MGVTSGNGWLYRTIRTLGRPFAYRVTGLQHVRHQGPAMYVANHLGSAGPIEVILSLPIRFFPWVAAEMTTSRRAPRYLYDDFIHPTWHLGGRLGTMVSRVVARIAVGLINGIGSVPVERRNGMFDESFERSLALLAEGKNLLIFPEDREAPLDSATLMRPFMAGFGRLCYLYQRRTGQSLPVYPVAIHPESKTVTIGEPVYWEPAADQRPEIREFCHQVQGMVEELYQGLACSEGQNTKN